MTPTMTPVRTSAPSTGPIGRRWELVIALSMAVVAVSGAVLTYLSVQQGSAAAEADQQALIETILVQQHNAGANAQTHALSDLAARYRRMMADADVVAQTDPQQAALQRAVADSFATQANIYEFLRGRGATARFDDEAQLQAALHYADGLAIPDDQPTRTAARADQHRDRSRLLAACAVGMLAIVVLLTLARVSPRVWLRVGLLAASGVAYVAAVTVAIPQAS